MYNRPVLSGIPLAALCAALALAAPPLPSFQGRWIDLTYAFDEKTIYWPTEKGFAHEKVFDGLTAQGYYYSAHRFSAAEHGGTHMDAPIHFYRGRRSLDEVPLEQLIGPAVLVDVSAACAENRDYQVQIDDLRRWEARWGPIPNGAIVLLRTGFGRFWPDRERYLGTSETGSKAVSRLHFPGLRADAAKWLLQRRSIKAVGIDTASIDHGPSKKFDAHVALFEANVPVFENVAALEQLPAAGFQVVALPMKIRGGSGGPLRIVALVR